MSTFRNSTVPEEKSGYFARMSTGDNQVVNSRGDRNETMSSPPQKFVCLSKEAPAATLSLKQQRMLTSVGSIILWHIISFVTLFILFPFETGNRDIDNFSFFVRAGLSCATAPICPSGVLFFLALCLTIKMLTVLLTVSGKFGISIQDQINRCLSLRFILTPIVLVLFVNVYYLYILSYFDSKYTNLLRSNVSSSDCTGEKESCYLVEENLVLMLAVSAAALEFFISSYVSGLFSLRFASVPVDRVIGGLFELKDLISTIRTSLTTAAAVGTVCLVFLPAIFATFLYPFGVKLWETGIFERPLLYLNVQFLLRLFLYTYCTRTILPMVLKVVNYHLTQVVHFHVEETAGHQNCLLLCEAMEAESRYLKVLAFYEYNFKADCQNTNWTVFFKTTHPGNHPNNWKNVFDESVKVISAQNENVVKFLKGAKMPTNFLQSGLGPYIIHHLRDLERTGQENTTPAVSTDEPRQGNMRDLRSTNRLELPNEIPTITDAVRLNLELVWNDMKGAVLGFFSVQTINTAVFGGRLDVKIEENVIANLLLDYHLSYWALMGTVKLICASGTADARGVVDPDIKPFLITILETYDTMTALEMFITKAHDNHPEVGKKVSDQNKDIAVKIANACVFSLAKLHETFSNCYPILDIEEDLKSRILEVIFNREIV